MADQKAKDKLAAQAHKADDKHMAATHKADDKHASDAHKADDKLKVSLFVVRSNSPLQKEAKHKADDEHATSTHKANVCLVLFSLFCFFFPQEAKLKADEKDSRY